MVNVSSAYSSYPMAMDQPSDSNYFIRRASEEQAAAARADDPRARQSHIDLAERYCNAARASGSADSADDDDAPTMEPSVAARLLQREFRILP